MITNRREILQQTVEEIELLSKMHLMYGLKDEPCFAAQKKKIADLIADGRINVRRELDPVSRNLFHRYFG